MASGISWICPFLSTKYTNLHESARWYTPGWNPELLQGNSYGVAPIESGEPKPREKNSAMRALVAYLFLWKFGKRHSDFRFPASDFKFILCNDLIDPLNYIFWLCFWQLPVGPNLLVYYHQLLLCTSFLLVKLSRPFKPKKSCISSRFVILQIAKTTFRIPHKTSSAACPVACPVACPAACPAACHASVFFLFFLQIIILKNSSWTNSGSRGNLLKSHSETG